ncbi:Putative protein C3orf32 [Chelonia mydas]|uniref:Uncharacterized protein n=1 Tax=Chelonia mydas TaxID=8469 RepID=M7BQQ0_CHEMY|nr:Putative protein C3orf32 [Chelonia mydas]
MQGKASSRTRFVLVNRSSLICMFGAGCSRKKMGEQEFVKLIIQFQDWILYWKTELWQRKLLDASNSSCCYFTVGNKGLPPRADQLPEGEHNDSIPLQTEWSILSISEHVAREALVQYTANKCCYRIAPAKRMVVQNLTPLNTFRYHLQTFTETRETFPVSEPYNGGFVDSSDVAPAPAPWEIEVDAPPLFTDCEMHIPVPHTYSVQDCPNCQGRGKNQCHSCSGSGKVYPLVNFPEPTIDRGSESCIAQHQMQFASHSRILRQKQTIELIPLTKVEYEWRGKVYSFYVFGNENKVYTEDYPAKCCCSVM